MIGIALALCAAFMQSLTAIFIRKSVVTLNYFSAAVIVTIVVNTILWPIFLILRISIINNIQAIPFFILAGILLAGVSRLLYYKSISLVGASVSASILAINPIFASIFAIFLLGEAISWEKWLGIMCIISGVIFIENHISKSESYNVTSKSLFVPLTATLTVATAYIFRKYGLILCNEPILDVAVENLSALTFLILISPFFKEWNKINKKNYLLLGRAGFCQTVAWIIASYAFNYEEVSIVTSIIQMEPLFVLLLAHFTLKDLERLSLKVLSGTILIIVGIILISFNL